MNAITVFQPVGNMGGSNDEENLAIAQRYKTELEKLFIEFSEGEWTIDVRLVHNYEGNPPLPVINSQLPYDDQVLILEELPALESEAHNRAVNH